MSWKDRIQVLDLDPDERLQATCKKCGHLHYLTRDMLMRVKDAQYLYISQVEQRTSCKMHGCWGRVRIAKVRKGDASAFVGGLA